RRQRMVSVSVFCDTAPSATPPRTASRARYRPPAAAERSRAVPIATCGRTPRRTLTLAAAPLPSTMCATNVYVPARAGCPPVVPSEPIVSPAGSSVAENVYGAWPAGTDERRGKRDADL